MIEWYELTLAAGGALVSNPHDPSVTEHLSLIRGVVEVEVDGTKKKFKIGGTARYEEDKPYAIRNVDKTESRALMVGVHR